MHRSIATHCAWLTVGFILMLGASRLVSAEERRPFDIEKRTLWTTSRIVGSPEPPSPYTTEVAFPKLKLYEPLAMDRVPGMNRFVVAQRPGKFYTFKIQSDVERKKLLLDIERTVYGVAMHPRFQENGYFFITSVVGEGKTDGNKSEIRVSRFQVQDPKSLVADANSETPIISWVSDGHKGGCIRFGPDGYLYISVGDGSGIADQLHTGQDLSDLLGSMLRIDVDHPSQGQPYGVPRDNPFVGLQGARPEIYSYGHRQVWKFSFHPKTGQLWGGEVGQDLWEMVYRIRKGGNYGWSVMEGSHPFRPERKKGPTELESPIVEHPHSDFRSITGGYFYMASRLPKLRGAYIYADYDTGRIWSFRYENNRVTEHRELCDTQHRVVAFAQDGAGEVYIVAFAGGQIHRLIAAPPRPSSAHAFPRKLSQTGLFESTADHRPMSGLIPYTVVSPLWADGAKKQRFIALPGDSQIELDAVTYPQPSPGAPPGWRFPDGAVLVKTFSLEMEVGVPDSLRRLETRILHHVRMPGEDDEYGAQYWYGYTYVWNEDQTDAELLAAEGLSREYTIRDAAAPGGSRKQVWRFPSRAECTLCHTMSSKYALGPQTLQMNTDYHYGGGSVANQMSVLERLGAFTEPLPKQPNDLPRLVDYRDESQDLDLRVRSYLHANCSHCHRKWGGGNADFQLLADLPLAETGMVDTLAGQGKFDLTDPRILVPGQPQRSLIYYRMTKLGLGRMPHIGSNLVDAKAVEMLRKWIAQLPK